MTIISFSPFTKVSEEFRLSTSCTFSPPNSSKISWYSSPISIIKKAKTGFNWDELKEKIMEWEPNRIIIGKPLNMDGTRSDFMEKVERFAKKLRSIIDVEIEFFDERLTSFEARQLDEDSEMIDDVAAKIILDSWLNNEHS